MTTCPLCGQPEHQGPCYAKEKAQWRDEEIERFLKNLGYSD